jgi:hypothetical protein
MEHVVLHILANTWCTQWHFIFFLEHAKGIPYFYRREQKHLQEANQGCKQPWWHNTYTHTLTLRLNP